MRKLLILLLAGLLSAFDLVEIAHFASAPSASDLAALQAWAETEYGAP